MIDSEYPLYQKGNPQLRVFLPNFWMKLVKPTVEQPKNVVQFITSVQMTNHDIKNYLEKIYKIPVIEVNTTIVSGEFKKQPDHQYVIKDDDYRRALVTLPRGAEFEFPEVFPEEVKEKEDEALAKHRKELRKGYVGFTSKCKKRPGVPGWFGL
ncbi:39S ribosomal protein L23, mitochondrial isoform X2 [Nilaparvata lugens]|uniref:39S ribosomal protein L23, mitochondrial isoform X2 n=1 Tax=Nilaparvata lugens TaxID=108931 RepID=UPI00193DDF37|nr:39S ribosomal protein L23, mitochondrial isoform X2 [Nilaparvata lugens]